MRVWITVLLGTIALAVGACGDDGGSSTGGDKSADTTTAPAAPAVSNDWALDYVGGRAGEADSAKAPLKVGYINQEGATPSFPEATIGLDAAVRYVNAELGGADGHPIEIERCFIQTEEDGQKCASQMANDADVKFVILGVSNLGTKAIYSVLTGRKPIISASPSTIDDLAARDAYAYTSGGPGIIAGMGIFTARYLRATGRVAVVHGDNAAAKQSAAQFLSPLLEGLGVREVKLVSVSDNASGPDVASALQAVGADKADALVTFVTLPGCIAVYDGLKSLGIDPQVVSTGLCFGTPMTRHLQDVGSDDPVPNGWYFASYGYSYYAPDEQSGMGTYVAKIRQYGGDDVEYTGFAGFTFADLLTSVKFINEIGADKLTPEAMRAKAKGFRGPMMLTAGPIQCGYSRLFAALCGQRTSMEQYKDGRWLPSAIGDRSIDVTPVLGG